MTVEKIWASLIQGLLSGCSVKMGPGGAMGRLTDLSKTENKSKKPSKARRAASSVSALQRNGSGTTDSSPPVIATGYSRVEHDFTPPQNQPSHRAPLPRTKSAPLTSRKRGKRGIGAPSTQNPPHPETLPQPPSQNPPLDPPKYPSDPQNTLALSQDPTVDIHSNTLENSQTPQNTRDFSLTPQNTLDASPRNILDYSPTAQNTLNHSSTSLNTLDHCSTPQNTLDQSQTPLHYPPSPQNTLDHSPSPQNTLDCSPSPQNTLDIPQNPSHTSEFSSSQSPSPDNSPTASPLLPQPLPNPITSHTDAEDEVTCAICLELLHRPRCLPCLHVFCLLCLQNYVNTYRSVFNCPTCRGLVTVPPGGLAALPHHPQIARTSKKLRKLRKRRCGGCGGGEEGAVTICGHCHVAWCGSCGPGHADKVREEVESLRTSLAAAKNAMEIAAKDDQRQLRSLEEQIEEEVEERVRRMREEGKCLSNKVKSVMDSRQEKVDVISKQVDQILKTNTPNQQQQLQECSRLHSTLVRLLKSTSLHHTTPITLDTSTLTLHTPQNTHIEEEEVEEEVEEEEEEEEEEKQSSDQDHSLMYRSKSSLARVRWGESLNERPGGVAINPWTSQIYVTGSDTCRVYIFDPDGRQVGSFGSRGHGEGQFLCPSGVAFSMVHREIYVTDKWRHCIHVVDCEGRHLRQIGRKGKGHGHFNSPEGVATDKYGKIYVADTCNNRVQVLDGDGVFVREIGVVACETLHDGHRYSKTEFNEPTGVAASLDGHTIYVADAGNHRVKVFDGVSGERVLTFGSRGMNKGQFERPECIVVDQRGFILVGDSGNGRIQVFRPNGNFVRYLGTRKSCHGEFGWVSGVALSRQLDVVVADFKNNLLAVF